MTQCFSSVSTNTKVSLTQFVWDFQYFGKYAGDVDQAIAAMFLRHRPQTLALLDYLRELEGFLLARQERVDPASMQELEDLALQRHRDDKRYVSVEEALHDGSRAAAVLLLLRAWQKEHARQEQIQEAEVQIRNAQQTITVLQERGVPFS